MIRHGETDFLLNELDSGFQPVFLLNKIDGLGVLTYAYLDAIIGVPIGKILQLMENCAFKMLLGYECTFAVRRAFFSGRAEKGTFVSRFT